MMPTEEERNKIVQAQLENPDIPLGSAEQFLLTLSSISELEARLKLWAFRLDYENMEKVGIQFYTIWHLMYIIENLKQKFYYVTHSNKSAKTLYEASKKKVLRTKFEKTFCI